jgi:hypothetical protein
MWPLRGLTPKGEGTKLGAAGWFTQAQKLAYSMTSPFGCEDIKECKEIG